MDFDFTFKPVDNNYASHHCFLAVIRQWDTNERTTKIKNLIYCLLEKYVSQYVFIYKTPHTFMCIKTDMESNCWRRPTTWTPFFYNHSFQSSAQNSGDKFIVTSLIFSIDIGFVMCLIMWQTSVQLFGYFIH